MLESTSTESRQTPKTMLWAAVGLVAFAALMRLAPHPWNFTPVAAMALFGGAALRRPLFAFGVPLAALALSDLALNAILLGNPWAGPNPWVYGSFIGIGLLGFALRGRRSPGRLAAASLAGSFGFFVVTNFGAWASGMHAYPQTPAGLAACYTAALPFFANTVAGDLFWNAALFGGLYALGRATDGRATGRA